MTPEHYKELMHDHNSKLSLTEINEGWHWCAEWDGLLVGPGMCELLSCSCFPSDRMEQLRRTVAEEDMPPVYTETEEFQDEV